MEIFVRTTIIRLENGDLIIHDPCKIDTSTKATIDKLGIVKYIVVPGSYHHLFVADIQEKYPNAETFLCPGLERKRPDIKFEWILENKPDHRWEDDIDQVLVQGTKHICEVAFFHKSSRTLILVDLLENIGDDYGHEAGLLHRFWWKGVFRMWNNPKIVKISLNRILTGIQKGWLLRMVMPAMHSLMNRFACSADTSVGSCLGAIDRNRLLEIVLSANLKFP